MGKQDRLAHEIIRKQSRKAKLGGWPKLINIPRNWAHQGLRYMDSGELSARILVEFLEILVAWLLMGRLFIGVKPIITAGIAFLVVHTWNWVTNGLFWTVIIFTFPSLRNPGAKKTVSYLNKMRERLAGRDCISAIAIYGSVTRGTWHDRSDIDIRLLRRPGIAALCCAAWITFQERFRAFIERQPMDLFLADDIDFLKKMRSDEIPLLTLCKDDRLNSLYPKCKTRAVQLSDLLGPKVSH